MLSEAHLCSEKSSELRRFLKVRRTLVNAQVMIKNEIHGLLISLRMKDTKASLQSTQGRQKILETLTRAGNGLVVQPLKEMID
ncbi:MAG: hypothetical protein SAMD01599839_24080 [Rectinema sp.]